MTDRPIIFSAPMVRALLDGRKTQTRRVLKPQPKMLRGAGPFYRPHPVTAPREWHALHGGYIAAIVQVRYAVGDRLWCREAWQFSRQEYCDCPQPSEPSPCDDWLEGTGCRSNRSGIDYRTDAARPVRWRPSIHMPRWASRLTLTVTDVRVQRLQEISEEDARAEGVLWVPGHGEITLDELRCDPGYSNYLCCRQGFEVLWGSLHGPGAWDANPWVAALTFTVERRNIDAGCGVMVETTPHAKKAAAIRLWNTRKQKEPTK